MILHLPSGTCLKLKVTQTKHGIHENKFSCTLPIVRSYKKQIIHDTPPANFRSDLTLTLWYFLETESDSNKAWDTWKQIFIQVADSHAPLKSTRVRGNFGPWITPNLKNLFQRDKLKNWHHDPKITLTGITG